MKVRLTKISSTHNNLRTDVVEGNTTALPCIGESFSMTSVPLDPIASIRWINTSPVRAVEELENGLEFRTENSVYKLEVLP